MSETNKTIEDAKSFVEKFTEVMKRAVVFQKSMTIAEVREARKSYDDPQNNADILAGMYWIARKRQDKGMPFAVVLGMTESEVLDGLLELLPEVDD